MAKKLILSKSDPALENLVESVLMEILDDEHGLIDSVKKEYIYDKVGIVFSTTITLFNYSLDLNDVYKGGEVASIINKLDLLSTIFKQFKRACRKIEEDGYNTVVYFNKDSVIIDVVSKEAEPATTIKVKPEVTLRKFKFERNYFRDYSSSITTIIPECEEHYIINCLGGIPEDIFNDLSESLSKPFEEVVITSGQVGQIFNKSRVKLIGWETPMPTREYDVYHLTSDCFKVTVMDIKSKRKYKVYGYLFKETEKEFRRRICEYAEKAIDIISNSPSCTRDSVIPFTIGTHFVEVEYAMCEAQKILMKYDKEDGNYEEGSCSIIEKCEEHAFNEQQVRNKRRNRVW